MQQRQLQAAARERRAAAKAAEAAAAAEAERARIARELHDVVSHAVTVIAVQAEAGQAVIDTDVGAARRSLSAIGTASREALAELARLLGVLGEDSSGPEPGLANLAALVDGARAAGLEVQVERSGDPRPLPAAVDLCAYRLVQESMTNALRHVGEARVRIQLRYDPSGVRVDIVSRGRPHLSSYGSTGHGLTGLRERVRELGGTLKTDATGGDVFELRAALPAT